MANKLIELLKRFNRKERFHLINQVTDCGMRLSQNFIDQVNECLTVRDVEIPDSDKCFVGMDYHIDWIYAALYLSKDNGFDLDTEEKSIGPFDRDVDPDSNRPFLQGNQEDIDLLIAYEKGTSGPVNLVLIEAKCDTAWSNTQIDSKMRRLHAIFKDEALRSSVVPHFCLMSPGEPVNLGTTYQKGPSKGKEYPEWVLKKEGEGAKRYFHIKMNLGGHKFLKPERSEKENRAKPKVDDYKKWIVKIQKMDR